MPSKLLNTLRQTLSPNDLSIAADVILGSKGAFPAGNHDRKFRDLISRHRLNEISGEQEVGFAAGRLNGWKNEVLEILGAIKTLAPLASVEHADALNAILAIAKRWGASNFLTKKTAYIMSVATPNPAIDAAFQEISQIFEQSTASSPYFLALEAVDIRFPYFAHLNFRVKTYLNNPVSEFRQLLALHNMIASPTNISDVGSFFRKANSMSMVDEVVAMIHLSHIAKGRWPSLESVIENCVDSAIANAIGDFCSITFDPIPLMDAGDPLASDIAYYRRSIAFLEFKETARYRQFVDDEICDRLVPDAWSDAAASYTPVSRRDLTKALYGFRKPDDYLKIQNTGNFLRTVNFTRYLRNNSTNAFSHFELRYIFENTTALDVLLSEEELERLYSLSDEKSRPIVMVLALALYKARTDDEDVDFKFRFAFCEAVRLHFGGSVVNFIDWLLVETPEIANFLTTTLDRATLQKLYWVISSADEADQIRQAILRSVGKVKEQIAYFVEADAIEAQRQVAKLKQFFDDSRIYVDGIAMKKWIVENPSGYSQEFVRMLEHNIEALKPIIKVISQSGKVLKETFAAQSNPAYDYILFEIVKVTFEQFCLNPYFGLDSYLGRRIRHNTLTGMMQGGITDLRHQIRGEIDSNSGFSDAFDKWFDEYKSDVEALRRDVLQFRTAGKAKGLFSSEIKHEDAMSVSNIALLKSAAISARSSEVFYDLLIRYCWQQIDPQLGAASSLFSGELLNKALNDIEVHLGKFGGDRHRLFKNEIRNLVQERYTRLASWFRQPESGFISATTKQVGNLIFVEAAAELVDNVQPIIWWGEGGDILIDGLSVHRVYDCLSVLIRNGISYGKLENALQIEADVERLAGGSVGRLRVVVTSEVRDDAQAHQYIQRLEESFMAKDLDAAMVREGYSGIKKLRFITKNSEGFSTATYRHDGGQCRVGFSLTVELAVGV